MLRSKLMALPWRWRTLRADVKTNCLLASDRVKFRKEERAKPRTFRLIDLDAAHFLFPRYITGDVIFEFSDELTMTFDEFLRSKDLMSIPRHNEWYDTDSFRIESLQNRGRHRVQEPSLLAMMYGPNPEYFPRPSSMIQVLDRWNGPRCLFLTDAVNSEAAILCRQLRGHLDFIIGLDAPPRVSNINAAVFGPALTPFSRATYERWVSTRIDSPRPIDVGFFGTKYEKRIKAQSHLVEQGIHASWVGGSYSGERLDAAQYLEKLCETKICVVTMHPYRYPRRAHIKGHVAEALMSKCLLLVDNSEPLSGLLKEGSEFVRYSSLRDLTEKVQFFLSHEDDRRAIATAGHIAFVNRFNLGNPWGMIFDDVT